MWQWDGGLDDGYRRTAQRPHRCTHLLSLKLGRAEDDADDQRQRLIRASGARALATGTLRLVELLSVHDIRASLRRGLADAVRKVGAGDERGQTRSRT